MEQVNHSHIYEDYSRFELKNLSPPELQVRLLADMQPYTDYEGRARISAAFDLAANLHSEDRRSPGEYISHPLRIANRLVTHFGIKDPDLVIAALLHDTVEDHPRDLSELANFRPDSVADAREAALFVVGDVFGARVKRIVEGVTNPIYDGTADQKNDFYLDHVTHAIQDQDVFLVKLSDFIDNAVGLHHTESAELIRKLSRKYQPLYELFRERLGDPGLPLSDATRAKLEAQLLDGQRRNAQHMAA